MKGLLRRGAAPARVQTRARVLLLSDRSRGERRTDEQVAGAVLTSVSTAKRTRWRFLQEGLEAALEEKPRPGRPPKITGEIEAQLIRQLTDSQPPEGHAHWTLRLLAGRLVELGYLESISHAAVGNRLKKNAIKPWQVTSWCIPKPSASFVCKMEDVLEVYHRPYDPLRPVVCLDERPKTLRDAPGAACRLARTMSTSATGAATCFSVWSR